MQAAPAGDDDYDEFINFWTVMNISRVVCAKPGSNQRRVIRIDAPYCGPPKKLGKSGPFWTSAVERVRLVGSLALNDG